MQKHKVEVMLSQGIWDMAIQEYGSVESVFDLLADNAVLSNGIQSDVAPGQMLHVISNATDQEMANWFHDHDHHPVTGPLLPMAGDFNTDFNDDYFNT